MLSTDTSVATPAIRVEDLRKTYPATKKAPAKEALKGVSLTVPRGSFFGLLGPNGAGKSTMINILAGLVLKTSGTAEICGHDIVTDMRQARGSLGVVPQELILDTFFTVRQALEIQAGYYGVPKAKRRTQEIIDAMGLGDKADAGARQLSGGMRRRLLVAKALVHNPPVLILDEPTAGVDVELRTQLWEYVKELNRNGTTVLLTTHYLEEAEELCDTIAIINKGTLIAHEPKRALLRRLDSKQLTIRPTQPLTAVPETLRAYDSHVTEEGELVIKYAPTQTPVASILEALCAANVAVADLATHEADLEDVFRQLTAA